jgi:hypothetical protein
VVVMEMVVGGGWCRFDGAKTKINVFYLIKKTFSRKIFDHH